MRLVRIFEDSSRAYQMPCELISGFTDKDGCRLLEVSVQFPLITSAGYTIPPGKRIVFFKHDDESGRFIEASNGLLGGFLQCAEQPEALRNFTMDDCKQLGVTFEPWLELGQRMRN
jgi:hypothetical protein